MAHEPAPHAQLACARCHRLATRSEDNALAPGAVCRDCHQLTQPSDTRGGRQIGSPGSSSPFHADPDRSCLDCHSFHATNRVSAAATRFDFAFGNDALSAHCGSCHTSPEALGTLSTGHRAAAALYHVHWKQLSALSLSDACMRCHSSTTGISPQALPTRARIPQFNQHASHPVGIGVVRGAGNDRNYIRSDLDPRLSLFDGRIECQTCHILSSETEAALPWFGSKYGFCTGCHQHDADPASEQPRPMMVD